MEDEKRASPPTGLIGDKEHSQSRPVPPMKRGQGDPLEGQADKPSPPALKITPTISRKEFRTKSILILSTLIALVVMITLVFILRVDNKPLIIASYERYFKGKERPEKVIHIQKLDKEAVDLFAQTVKEIQDTDKKANDFVGTLKNINDRKKIEEFIPTIRLEKDKLVSARARIEEIKNELEGSNLTNLKTTELDAAIENARKIEEKLNRIDDSAYQRMAELRAKEPQPSEVVITGTEKPTSPTKTTLPSHR